MNAIEAYSIVPAVPDLFESFVNFKGRGIGGPDGDQFPFGQKFHQRITGNVPVGNAVVHAGGAAFDYHYPEMLDKRDLRSGDQDVTRFKSPMLLCHSVLNRFYFFIFRKSTKARSC